MRALRCLSLLLGLLALVPAASAQELMRENIFRRLERAYKLFEENKNQESLNVLESLAAMSLNREEEGQTRQLMGFNYLALERYADALDAFDRALATGSLPTETQKGLRRDLISLAAQVGRWEDCLRRLEAFLPTDPDPKVDLFTTGATAASELKRYEEALRYILEAIRRSPEPHEVHYQSWAAYLFELDRMTDLAQVLEIMIRLFPDKPAYWEQLSNLYLQLREDQKALAIMTLAYQRGFLQTEAKLSTYVTLLLYMELPYRAAQVLSAAIDAGKVSPTFKNLDTLGNAWTAARETERAIATFERAADLDPTGETHYRLGQLHIEAEDWPAAIREFRAAQARGNLKQEGQLHIYLGYALFSTGDLHGAIAEFERASEFPSHRATAEQWLGHARDELAAQEPAAAGEPAGTAAPDAGN